MSLQYVCKACGRRLTVPDELFASKIRGRLVTVKCKGCGAPIGIDGTVPPPPIEPLDATSSTAQKHEEPNGNSKRSKLESTQLGHSERKVTLAPEAKTKPEPSKKSSKDNESTPSSEPPSKPFSLSRRSSRPPPNQAAVGVQPQKPGSLLSKVKSDPPTAGKVIAQPPRPNSQPPAVRKHALPSSQHETSKKAALPSPAIKLPNSSNPPPQVTERNAIPPPSSHTEGEPEITATALDESWDMDSMEERSDRFSHVDGSLPIKLPTARIGRYALFDQFAEGGIATVHFGRIDGAGGFSRIVAIKRLLPHLAANEEFTEMLLKEARFAARVRHPNVVPTLDVVASQGDVLLILEYIHGESLSALCRKQAKSRKDHIPVEIAVAVMLDVLSGLSAVHEAIDEKGRLLGLVHRDISPPNVVVGADGYARVLDFGIAKALEHIEESMPTRLKGKIGYMAPEQIRGEGVSQRSDVFAAGVILWELLATRRLFGSKNESERMKEIVAGNYPSLSRFRAGVPKALEQVTMRALSVDPNQRFTNSREFADALEQASPRASARRVAEWVADLATETLGERARMMAQVENWNAGPEIPLHSSAFTAETAHAIDSAIPPQVRGGTAPSPIHESSQANTSESDTLAVIEGQTKNSSRNSPWLLVASCVILLLALYYTIWK